MWRLVDRIGWRWRDRELLCFDPLLILRHSVILVVGWLRFEFVLFDLFEILSLFFGHELDFHFRSLIKSNNYDQLVIINPIINCRVIIRRIGYSLVRYVLPCFIYYYSIYYIDQSVWVIARSRRIRMNPSTMGAGQWAKCIIVSMQTNF